MPGLRAEYVENSITFDPRAVFATGRTEQTALLCQGEKLTPQEGWQARMSLLH